MSVLHQLLALITASAVVAAGLLAAPYVFADRLSIGAAIGPHSVGGLTIDALPLWLAEYERNLQQQDVEFVIRGVAETISLGSLGVTVDAGATTRALVKARGPIAPVVNIDRAELNTIVETHWLDDITLPQNATLAFNAAGTLIVLPSTTGEGIDVVTLEQDVLARARSGRWHQPIELMVISAPPTIHEGEVEAARTLALDFLGKGFTLALGEQTWTMPRFMIERLLRFVPQVDPVDPDNYILGVALDQTELQGFLTTTIAPEIDQPAVNARFERVGDRVTQFALPQQGRALDIAKTEEATLAAIAKRELRSELAIAVTDPTVKDTTDIESLGVAHLLATGTSDFAGSPANRMHNISVGTTRYHGLLIPPAGSFSFNEFLGPVDGAHGFKPELVIKHNVTTPEFGGGLCQVSTTAFRAALNAGLEITDRRNHAYAVRYYGKPGLDATIYPPYTDLRFTNNTPGYILIQTRIEGTKLSFDFWGTDDGREVVVTEPYLYDRQANGALKASVSQTVTRGDEVIIEDTFYSRYRSPALFPTVVAANDPTG